MADKRISQLVDRGTVANNDVVPIVVSGATTTNKATISSIQTYMQGNLDLGVTSVGITLGSSGTDVSVSGSPITSSGNITINLPTASATNRGLLSAADWVTFNSKQDAGSFVTLDTTQTITAQKTFTTSGSSDTMIISHGSGSGFALDVLKAGNGETLRVTKTSGSGNAMTVIGGNFEAPTIVKTGGTSSQFLKADGSVDSSTYLTTGTAASTYVPYTGATGNVDLGTRVLSANNLVANGGFNSGALLLKNAGAASLIDTGYFKFSPSSSNTEISFGFSTGASTWKQFSFSSHLITDNTITMFSLPNGGGTLALTTDIPSLAGYVTLATTQTITGAKTFDTTTSDFLILNSTNANGGVLSFRRNGTNVGHIGNSAQLGGGVLDAIEVRSGIGSSVILKTDGGQVTLATGGGVTLTGALNGTSASFTGAVTISNTSDVYPEIKTSANDADAFLGFTNTGDGNNAWSIGRRNTGEFWISNYTGNFNSGTRTEPLKIASTGAATFNSSVTATGGVYAGDSKFFNSVQLTDSLGGTCQAFLWTDAANTLKIGTGTVAGGNVKMTITSTGNVGIGTASPSSKLTVLKTITTNVGATGNAALSLGTAGSSGEYNLINFGYDAGTWQPAYLGYVATSGAGSSNGALVFGTRDLTTDSQPTERMRITSVGNTQPGADNAYSLGVSGTRWSAVWAANGTIQTSDEREKKEIIDSDLGLDFVNQLRPVSFKWKVGQNVVSSEIVKDEEGNPILDEEGNEKTESVITPREGKRTHYGLIAQEVEELLDGKDFGGFIHDEETDTKGLRYDQFVPLLIKSIQELNQKIAILESKLK